MGLFDDFPTFFLGVFFELRNGFRQNVERRRTTGGEIHFEHEDTELLQEFVADFANAAALGESHRQLTATAKAAVLFEELTHSRNKIVGRGAGRHDVGFFAANRRRDGRLTFGVNDDRNGNGMRRNRDRDWFHWVSFR